MLLAYLKNSIEIIILSSFFYYFSLWLKKDKEKNLIWYFYSYCFLFFGSWYCNFYAINIFMLYTCPLMCLILLIIHQDILQRNFISLKKDTVASKNNDYLEQLLRAGLATLNKNKTFYCVIEQSCEIKPFVKTDLLLKADLTQEHIAYLIESASFDEKKFLWCSSLGYIIAINAEWRIHQTHAPLEASSIQNHWKEDAILMTSKTDAYVIKGNPNTRLFDLVAQGKIHEQLSAHQVLQTLKMHIVQLPITGEKIYESSHKKIINQQQNS